jgi:hypothetical protein
MLDAWNVDRAIANLRSGWLMIRADRLDARKLDERHFESEGIRRLYAQLEPMMASR